MHLTSEALRDRISERGERERTWLSNFFLGFRKCRRKVDAWHPTVFIDCYQFKKKKKKRILAEFKTDKGQHHRIGKLFPKMSRAFSLVYLMYFLLVLWPTPLIESHCCRSQSDSFSGFPIFCPLFTSPSESCF